MKRSMRILATALVAAACTVTVSSCGTAANKPTAGEIDVRTLDVGKYPIEPLDINADQEPGTLDWSQAGSVQMAEVVATPDQVDPKLIYNAGEYQSESFTAAVPKQILGDSDLLGPILQRDHMYFGFTTTGLDKASNDFSDYHWPALSSPGKGLAISVMQFGTEDDAKRAATDLYNARFDTYHDQNQPVPLPKYPDAHAQWQPGVASLEAFLPHGRYVTVAMVATPTADLGALTALAQQTFDVQQPLLDTRKLISDMDAVRLPLDPDYLLSRTLNPEQSESPSFDDVNLAVGAHTYLHYTMDRHASRTVLDALGATAVARTDAAVVVKARDTATAKKAVTEHLSTRPNGAPADAPPRVPDSACMEYPNSSSSRYTCMVAYRQYVGYVQAGQLTDAQQRAAAQYALLANSQWE
ncbi:DUF7373 family lipoprotein [Nocardia stercoris]|uniref:Uncharacterized protein n=1 Tax=Nocardia stercoris TaxID=2483361 RepID=A0A3M2L2G5_9NOCA|nr:hypothetical protein [Nocardia stercoris]RMI31827.1 hypothetical protein EBN03_16765 [Nocardia stercoris]